MRAFTGTVLTDAQCLQWVEADIAHELSLKLSIRTLFCGVTNRGPMTAVMRGAYHVFGRYHSARPARDGGHRSRADHLAGPPDDEADSVDVHGVVRPCGRLTHRGTHPTADDLLPE